MFICHSGTSVDYHIWEVRVHFRHWILWWRRSGSVLFSLFIIFTTASLIFKKHTFLLKIFVVFPEGLVKLPEPTTTPTPYPSALWDHFLMASVLLLGRDVRNPVRCSCSLCHDPAYAGKSPLQVPVVKLKPLKTNSKTVLIPFKSFVLYGHI